MATYLQGVTDYIPQVQPWTPDYNFYQGALERKQQQYDMGWEKTNTMYNSLLNAPMTRGDNIGARDNFFKDIEQNINRLSGLDLSLPQNVDAASQLFTPLINDKYIVNDMGWTKRWQNEQQTVEAYRNCTDSKKCGDKYWEEGARELEYRRADYQKATRDGALSMPAPKYTPYTNAVEKSFDKIKDNKFGTKIQSISPDGRYIVTEKNGQNIVQPLTSYLASTLGNDPAVAAMYRTKAYVRRNDWMAGNAGNYGNEEEAESAYYEQFVQPSVNTIEKVNQDIRTARKDREVELTSFEKMISVEGIVPGSEEHKEFNELDSEFNKMLGLEEQSDSELNTARNITNSTNANAMRMNSDAAVASSMFFDDMFKTAVAYHELTYEREIKADPYAMASFKEGLAFNYGIRRDALKNLADRELFYDKVRYEQGLADGIAGGTWRDNSTGSEDDLDGTTVDGSDDTNQANVELRDEIRTDLMNAEAEFLANIYNQMMQMDISNHDEVGWTWDFAQIFTNTGGMKKLHGDEWDQYKSVSGDGTVRKLKRGGQANITAAQIQELPANLIDRMYKMAKSKMDPRVSGNKNKNYAKNIWSSLTERGVNSAGEEGPSMYSEVEYQTTLRDLSKKQGGLQWFGDPDSHDPNKRMGLGARFTNTVMNGDATITPGFNGYDNSRTGDRITFTGVADGKHNKFIKAGINNFITKDGYKRSYKNFEQTMLKEGISWYGKTDEEIAQMTPEETANDLFSAFGYEERDNINRINREPGAIERKVQDIGSLFNNKTFGNFDLSKIQVDAISELFEPGYQNPLYAQDGDRTYAMESSGFGGGDGMNDARETQGSIAQRQADEYLKNNPAIGPDGKPMMFTSENLTPIQKEQRNRRGAQLSGAREAIHKLYYGEHKERGGEKSKYDKGLDDLHYKIYSRDPNAMNIRSYLGGGSGGTTGLKAVHENINPTAYGSVAMQFSRSVFQNITSAEGVVFLDPSLNGGKGLELVNEFGDYVYGQRWKGDAKNKPKFTVKYLANYKGGGDYQKAQIIFDKHWVEANDGTKKNPGLTGTGGDKNTNYSLSSKGIEILIPTSQVNNRYAEEAVLDKEDLLVKAIGHYDWQDKYPLAGNIEIRYDNKKLSYYVAGMFEYYDDGGNKMRQHVSPEHNEAMRNNPLLTFSEIRKAWEPKLRKLDADNRNYMLSLKSQYGVKDPNKLRGTSLDVPKI